LLTPAILSGNEAPALRASLSLKQLIQGLYPIPPQFRLKGVVLLHARSGLGRGLPFASLFVSMNLTRLPDAIPSLFLVSAF